MNHFKGQRNKTFSGLIMSLLVVSVVASLSIGFAQMPKGFNPNTVDLSTLPGEHLPIYKGRQFIPLKEQGLPERVIQRMRQEVDHMNSRGHIDAPESQVLSLDLRNKNTKKHRAMQDVASALSITPADVSSSILGQAQIVDVREAGTQFNDRWTGVNRLFIVKKFGLVALDEYDFTLSEGGVAIAEELCNQRVNGHPAALRVKQSPSKRGVTELTWVTEKKLFTLTVNRPLKSEKKIDEFIQLAESIQ